MHTDIINILNLVTHVSCIFEDVIYLPFKQSDSNLRKLSTKFTCVGIRLIYYDFKSPRWERYTLDPYFLNINTAIHCSDSSSFT